MTPLTRDLIRAVATEEASAACADLNGVLGMAFGTHEKLARRRAMQRLLRETGCEASELAKLWGCDRAVVIRLRHRHTPPRSTYDVNTVERLRWQHGDERTLEIIHGRDAATCADVSKWRSLGMGRDA